MTTSINQPWAISDEFRNRYGNMWADLDFEFYPKISKENFKTDPMNVTMGELKIGNQSIPMRYKDLLSYSKSIEILSANLYAERPGKSETFEVSIRRHTFMMTKTEIGKLSDTLHDACTASLRGYEIGLYL
jgi:hypothetical protein